MKSSRKLRDYLANPDVPTLGGALRNVAQRILSPREYDSLARSANFPEALYLFAGNKLGACRCCGKPTKFQSTKKGYREYCSPSCMYEKRVTTRSDRPRLTFHKRLEKIFLYERDDVGRPNIMRILKTSCVDEYNRVRQLATELGVKQSLILYHTYVGRKVGRCLVCGDPSQPRSRARGYKDYCCVECAYSEEGRVIAQGRCRETSMIRYGFSHPHKDRSVRTKWERTCRERFGYDHPMKHPDIEKRRKKTCLERYGHTNAAASAQVREKIERTCLVRFGHKNSWGSSKVRKKMRATTLERYGYENAMQNPGVLRRQQQTQFTRKTLIVKGKQFTYQGYEHFAIIRLAARHPVSRIHTAPEDMPEIWYRRKRSDARYTPDIRVGSLLIEVKSLYTLGLDGDGPWQRKSFQEARLKARACREAGYRFLCVVFNGKGRVLLKCDLSRYRRYYVRQLKKVAQQ